MPINSLLLQASFQPNPNYMSLQPYINHKMRAILVDWLILVQVKFDLLPETFYLTVSIIDRFLEVGHTFAHLPLSLTPLLLSHICLSEHFCLCLSFSIPPFPLPSSPSLPLSLSLLPHSSLLYPGQTHFYLSSSPPLSPCSLFNITLHTLLLAPPNIHFQVHVTTKDKLQLTGVTAMLIASKYEEIYYPQVADFSYITDHTYSEDDIRRMEQFMLQTIGYRLGSPAPIHFLRRFSKLNQVSHKTKVAQA